ncbi:MFS transporter [Tanticharoenia sakaeratensis]|uniref:Major facilitator superfamily protein n=1 Tax=Tanticharoenia sakaeratensis NBRC 103193 TaxID=1231623 RepID=A0A0D6MI12_9PROT|nr:MFS transporter [Tanticharoenia sakaeratensis]GAN53115.1 major facilitator superfamily protein [Tanticharoenia sakaeratensis NBRC 103193]
MTGPASLGRMVAQRRATVGLLVAAGCISYVDRAALSVGNTAVMASLGLSYTQMGWLLSVFAWAYLVCQIPMGLIADRTSARSFLGVGLVVWSGAQIAFGLVGSVFGLFACRALLGLGEAPLFLAGTRALVRWYPPQDRGAVIGLFNGSAALGPALAPPLLLGIMAVWGWRGMSVAIGVASLALAVVWIAFYRDPTAMHPTAEARRAFAAGSAAPPASVGPVVSGDLGYLLQRRATWVVTIGFAGVIYVTWLYGTWLPAWLEATQHVSARNAGLLSALPQICGFVGCLAGGTLSDWLMRRGFSALDACRRPVVWAMLVAAVVTGLTALPLGLGLSMFLMAIALFAGGLAMSCGWTLGTVIASEHRVATLEAIQNTGGSFGGALAPAVTGALADRFGSFGPSMLTACAVGIVCAGVYHFGLRSVEKP